jgi:DNA-directed RNA polymerase specialized sigma24 family protein
MDPLKELEAIVMERMQLDLRQQDTVLQARRDGLPWRDIGNALNRTTEAVRKRYGGLES